MDFVTELAHPLPLVVTELSRSIANGSIYNFQHYSTIQPINSFNQPNPKAYHLSAIYF